MSVRNLDRLFQPRSIAVIGASKRPQSVGAVLSRNLFNAGFEGPVLPVNPREQSIRSTMAYPCVEALPIAPDLAVICTPPKTVPALIDQLGRRGTKAAVVITAGFGEGGDAQGKALMQATLDAARPHLLRIVGPNCVGVMTPHRGINASFVHVNPLPGDIAFVTQSGAIATSIVDWATARGIGFSHVVSLGDMGDVDFGDMLDYLAMDPKTKAILLYIESITHARKFLSAGRAAARTKPVIVIKSGRSDAAAAAAASHTGALAGSDAVYDAAFRRAGMLRVNDLAELFDAVETLAMGIKVKGDRLAILTNGGGIGVLATDHLVEDGGRMATLSDATMQALDAQLPPTWSKGNPVDIIGDAPGARYAGAFKSLLDERGQDAILVMNCPTAVADSLEAAQAVVATLDAYPGGSTRRPAVLTSWLGDGAALEARKLFAQRKIPTYETPGQATRAFMHLVHYRQNQDLLMETPSALGDDGPVDGEAARAIIDGVFAEGRDVLTEPEAKAVLAAFGIPVIHTATVKDAEAAAREAAAIGKPVALKILSPDILHKSDMGGVRLNLRTPDQVRAAAEDMLATIAAQMPNARIEGFTVQAMANMPGAHELIVGIADDRLFGPTILFGKGGTEVEVVKDSAIALPPLSSVLARDTMRRTRVWDLLQGYRNRPPADLDAIASTLIRVGQIAIDLPEVVELDVNPLLANETGVLALDARIKLRRMADGARGAAVASRLAIRPYPKALEKLVTLRDGRRFLLRPVRPEDEPLLQGMILRSSPEDVRLRFFTPLRELSHPQAARLTQIDYDREMALVAIAPDDRSPRQDALYGVVRIAADPDNERAEYGVMVRSDLKGKGLGHALMDEILGYAAQRGIGEVYGEVLRENTTMLAMCLELGFQRTVDPDDPGIMLVRCDLDRYRARAAE